MTEEQTILTLPTMRLLESYSHRIKFLSEIEQRPVNDKMFYRAHVMDMEQGREYYLPILLNFRKALHDYNDLPGRIFEVTMWPNDLHKKYREFSVRYLGREGDES